MSRAIFDGEALEGRNGGKLENISIEILSPVRSRGPLGLEDGRLYTEYKGRIVYLWLYLLPILQFDPIIMMHMHIKRDSKK